MQHGHWIDIFRVSFSVALLRLTPALPCGDVTGPGQGQASKSRVRPRRWRLRAYQLSQVSRAEGSIPTTTGLICPLTMDKIWIRCSFGQPWEVEWFWSRGRCGGDFGRQHLCFLFPRCYFWKKQMGASFASEMLSILTHMFERWDVMVGFQQG